MFGYLQPIFNPNLLLRKLPCFTPQHLRPLLQRHPHLRLTNGHKTFRKIQIVLLHEFDGQHDVVYVFEDEGALRCVFVFGAEEGGWVVAPVAAGVEVVRCVVAVVEAEAV